MVPAKVPTLCPTIADAVNTGLNPTGGTFATSTPFRYITTDSQAKPAVVTAADGDARRPRRRKKATNAKTGKKKPTAKGKKIPAVADHLGHLHPEGQSIPSDGIASYWPPWTSSVYAVVSATDPASLSLALDCLRLFCYMAIPALLYGCVFSQPLGTREGYRTHGHSRDVAGSCVMHVDVIEAIAVH
jgi:hypothetical protein